MSFANSNDNLPNGQTNLWDDESTPRSSGADDNLNDTMEVPFHGSCPKCHHFHTNSPFTIFTNSTKHTRFQCDVCQHHILGIGRASTQTTLASVESIPVPSNRLSGISRPSNLQICVNAPPQTSTVNSPTSPDQVDTPAHLSTIAEANTLNGRSRSPSYRQARVSMSPQRGNSPSPRALLRDNGTLAREESGDNGESPVRSHSRSKLRALFRRGKARFLSRLGELKIFGYNVKITRASPDYRQDSRTPPPNLSDVEISPTDARVTARSTGEFENPVRSTPNPPSPIIDTSEELANLSSNIVHDEARPTNPQQPEAEQVQDPTMNAPEVESDEDQDRRAAAKKEKIRARRREATLKSEAVRKPYCHCRVGCPCLGDGGESDGTSESHVAAVSIPVSEVPGHPVPSLVAASSRSSSSQTSRANALVGIGTHLPANRRISLAENSSSGADGNRRQANRFSQDTTNWGSNASSISLTGRRSSPGLGFVNAAPGHRSSGRFALQTYEDVNQHQGSSRGRDSVELPTRESEISSNDPNPIVNDEIPTSLVNTPNLRPEEVRRPHLSDGTSVSSNATCIGDDSEQLENEERTPRPHSHNAAVDDSPNAVSGPSPENLSTALTRAAERQTDD